MGYDDKTIQLTLELADNIEYKRNYDIDGAKVILMSDFDLLCTVMQIWADNQRYYALDKFKEHLTDVEKQIIRLELTHRK